MITPPVDVPLRVAERDTIARGLQLRFGDRELGLRFFQRPPASRSRPSPGAPRAAP